MRLVHIKAHHTEQIRMSNYHPAEANSLNTEGSRMDRFESESTKTADASLQSNYLLLQHWRAGSRET